MDEDERLLLLRRTRPKDWINPFPSGRYNLAVVGAGTAGLVSAVGGRALGARVALIETRALGGECLHDGCVPSKALIASARVAAAIRESASFGIRVSPAETDFGAVMCRMRRLRAKLAANDSVERMTRHGIDVYFGTARFAGLNRVLVADREIEFARAVIATGSRPRIPELPGLEEAGYLTNETLFDLAERPSHMLVLGGGPMGCEMGQALRRLGCQVTILQRANRLLPREDLEASSVLERRLSEEGIAIITGARAFRVSASGGAIRVEYEKGQNRDETICDKLLVATGRAPNVENLGLEQAGVKWNADGVVVNDRLRTSNRRIYAAGDICARHKFTHMADAMARIVLINALFGGFKRTSRLMAPHCTYTSPEIAHVGFAEHQAIERGYRVDTISVPLDDVDRAVLDGASGGFVRIVLERGKDRILGATVVAEHAGEMISEITLAMAAGIGLSRIATAIHPYPTQAEAIRKAADTYNRRRLTPAVRKLLGWWMAMRR